MAVLLRIAPNDRQHHFVSASQVDKTKIGRRSRLFDVVDTLELLSPSGPTRMVRKDFRVHEADRQEPLLNHFFRSQRCMDEIRMVPEFDGSLQDKVASVTVDRPERVETIVQAIGSLGYRATVAGSPPATTSATAD